MEIHLKANYDEFKRLKCNKCTKEFLLEWQLRRHMENHEKQNGRKCNYYNDYKTCPYEEIGCILYTLHEQ